ncbi:MULTISPECIES: MFS transporter [Micrococcaceae]|uniref:MFS transporter n=1 Tax=unclassified Kocuria TaxID=2649579 RepID=UPI001EDD7603|nr:MULTISPECIES: MFS transporter [unclassified Kocuria]
MYLASGLSISAWLVRVPAIAQELDLSAGPLGILLLSQTLGAFLSVSASGMVVMKLGAQKTLWLTFVFMMLGGLGLAVGVSFLHSVLVAGIGLALFGLGQATFSVAANVQGAAVERALKKQRMPLMHGCFSVGTVIGSVVGTAMTAMDVSVFWHMLSVYVVVIVLVAVAMRYTRHEGEDIQPGTTGLMAIVDSGHGTFSVRHAWSEKRTVLLGIFVLGMALAEGSANDWVALALTNGYGASASVGAIGYGLFVTAMTTGRLLGTGLLNVYGRIMVMRIACVLAVIGLGTFVVSPWIGLGMVAIFVWGIGAALGFPVGMSAAADDPVRASARVSVVSTIGYGAFLGGPPLLGVLGEALGVRNGLAVVLLLVIVSLCLVPQLRTPEKARRRTAEHSEDDSTAHWINQPDAGPTTEKPGNSAPQMSMEEALRERQSHDGADEEED